MDDELVRTGIDIIGPVPWGTHFCQFYQTREDLLDILVPYFKAGLENNEFCMWITAEPLSAEEASQAMRRVMPDFADRLAKGQIEIMPHTEWYLKGGSFNLGRVLNSWVDKLSVALAKGYGGLRVTGNTAWLERRDWDSFTEYEAAINGVIGMHRMVALCTYSLGRCNAADVMDVIRNHEFALIRKEGKWELIENAIHKQAKQALLESERKYRGLVESLHEGVGTVDKDLHVTFVNPHMAEMLGYTTDEILGKPLFNFIKESDQDAARQLMERRIQGVADAVEFAFRRKDGSPLHVLISATPLFDDQGDFSSLVAGVVDITERKRMEEALRRSEARLKRAQQIAHLGSWELDLLNNHLIWSDEVYRIFGLQPQEFGATYEAFLEAVHPDDRAAVDGAYSSSLREGRDTYEIEHRVVRRSNGEIRFVRERCEHIRDASGRITRSVGMVHDITERKQVEESLRETRDYLDNLLNYANAPIIVWDREFRITKFNRAFQRLTGYKENEVLGKELHILFPEQTKEESLTHIRRAVAGERWEVVEIPILRVDGEVRTVLWNSATICASDGKTAVATMAQGQDITERKRAEEQLEFQVNILSNLFDAVVAVDNDHRVTYWNRVAEELYGLPADKAIGQKAEDLYQQVWLNPEDKQDSANDLATKGHWIGENIHVKKNGERIYARSSVSMIADEDGTRAGMVSVIRDRTRLWQAEQEVKILNERLRQQAEERLRATDASFRRAIASSADGIVVVRKDGIIRFANPAAESLLGWEAGKMVGTLFGFPLTERAEIEIPKENGRKAIAEMRIVELDWEGAPAYLATLRDITQRKEGLLALQESETRLRLLLDQIPCVSWTLDTKLRFTSFTGSGLEAFNAVPDHIQGMTLAEYFKVDDLDFTPYMAHRQALQGIPATYELTWAERTFYSRVESLRDADDRIVGVVGVAFDITERKQAEEQLRNLSHRLVTAQENERRKIARELHDEVGQSLTALKLSLDKVSLARSGADGAELGLAREALQDLMARVRSMSLELRPTMLDDLGLLPTLLWHFKRYTAQTNVQVHFKHRGLRRDLPQDTITAAYRIVQEALTNVARYAHVTEVLVCVRAEYDALVVEVEDQGVGFDPDKVAPASMGLNGMRERALSLKGKLLVQSTPGEGTCVIAELPLAKRGRKRIRSKENDNRSSSG